MPGSVDDLGEGVLARRWALADAERHALIRLALRKGLSSADAEDCVQEAILAIVPRPDLDEARIGALLATTVMRRAIDLHRRRASAARACARLRSAGGDSVDAADVALCDRAEAEWSASVVDRLPPFQRQVLVARAEGRSWADIARELSTTVKAVESAVSRARATVRVAIASTLGIGAALARRWRAPGTVLASGGAAVVLVAFTVPLLRHVPDAPGSGAPSTGNGSVVRLAAPASVRAGALAAPGSSTIGFSRVDHAAPGGRHARPHDPPGRTETIASVSSPVENDQFHQAEITRTEREEDPVTNMANCIINYSVDVQPPEDTSDTSDVVHANCKNREKHL